MCNYHDDTGYKCPHENLEDNDYCIFHLQDDNKNVDEFNKGIKKKLESKEDSINLEGFYFPPDSSDFSEQNFQKEINFYNVMFSGKADFGHAEFSEAADFRRAKFSEAADFSDAEFSKTADFSDAEFSGRANLRRVKFSGRANFYGAEFSKTADFLEAEFSGKAYFERAEFSEIAEFMYVEFSETVNFHGVKFSETVNFHGVKFSGRADFMYAEFSEIANFFYAEFSEACFVGAKFSGKANFGYAKFLESNFRIAEFSKTADFGYAKFSGKADFGYAKFLESDFKSAEFSKTADFGYAKFSEADFKSAKFSGTADFGYVKFLESDFKSAEFSKTAYFFGAKFSETAVFVDAKFSETADFRDAELTGKFVFIPEKSETIIFKNTYFSDNVRIKTDMSKCSFANSNIERADMTDSSWMRDDKPKNPFSAFGKWLKNKMGISETSIKIWEEHQCDFTSNWKELEGIYRRLKQSYQKYGDNSTSGKFYYQEMECKRQQLKRFEKYFWYFFFNKLCGYGEKPFNVIFASLFLIISFAFTYFFGGIEFVGSSVLKVSPNVIQYNLSLNLFCIQWVMSNIDSVLEDFLLCLYTSIITFTTLGYGDVRPIGLSRIFASLEAGFGIIMTALFIFVFTRKMLR